MKHVRVRLRALIQMHKVVTVAVPDDYNRQGKEWCDVLMRSVFTADDKNGYVHLDSGTLLEDPNHELLGLSGPASIPSFVVTSDIGLAVVCVGVREVEKWREEVSAGRTVLGFAEWRRSSPNAIG